MHITEYFEELAAVRAAGPLPQFASLDELQRWQRERRAELREAWGLPEDIAGLPPKATVTGRIVKDGYDIERLYFESLDGLVVTANLYIPHGDRGRRPAMLYLCGHAPLQKARYQDHCRRFAQLGFVTLVVDTIQYGEIPGLHHGTWEKGAFNWASRGYSPVAVEAWNASRAIDLLCARDDVDSSRIGVTGISGGGAVSWWVAAIDPRVAAIASSSGTGAEWSHLAHNTLAAHCDCFFPNNPYGRSLAETYLLVAPKPVMIVAAEHDHVFHLDSVRQVSDQLAQSYSQLGLGHLVRLVVTDSEHQYTSRSRREIFAWMLTHVAGVSATADEVDDIDGVRMPDTELRVLPTRLGRGAGPSASARHLTPAVQEWFIPLQEEELDDAALAERIRARCLAFAPQAIEAEPRIGFAFRREGVQLREFTFATEGSWRLRGQLRSAVKGEQGGPVVVALRAADDGQRLKAHGLASAWRAGGAHAVADVRGTGSTAWHPSLNWLLRRAAIMLGRSIAGMQVVDALHAVAAVRELSGGAPVELAAEGDLAAVAMVCGILDPRISQIVVRDAPESFDAPGSPDGGDRVIEITNILRYTDLPDIAGRLRATQRLTVLGEWQRER